MLNDYEKRIKAACDTVYEVAKRTPLDAAPRLSGTLNNEILLKREDLQPVFSFKLRGAYNRIAQLTEEELARGVIAASAGNHAQGVALAAKRKAIHATIVMPKTTPRIKVEAVRNLGAEVVLHGNTYDDASCHAHKLIEQTGAVYIHPYDDPDVIAGQGTVAVELLEQHPGRIDAVFIPVGGGGLVAGMAAWIKQHRPETRIIGIEPDDAPCLHAALAAGERVTLEHVGIFADGVAVRQVGEEPFRVVKDLIDEVILVSTDEICAAIMDIYDDTRAITEPAGALAVAGIKKYVARESLQSACLVAVNSGANMNFDRLRHVAERAEIGEQREALFAVTIPERPGSFRDFCKTIGEKGITEFNYRYSGASEAHVFVGVQLNGPAEREALISKLKGRDYPVVDMTDNEMAKIHVRYMVGGHSAAMVDHELLYRFEFPERPGALLRFLSHMGHDWNISLFHYRNHGAAYGRVLVGIQVPPAEQPSFQNFLDEVGYSYWEEVNNPAYQLFLS
jgi:threonine dehydratase